MCRHAWLSDILAWVWGSQIESHRNKACLGVGVVPQGRVRIVSALVNRCIFCGVHVISQRVAIETDKVQPGGTKVVQQCLVRVLEKVCRGEVMTALSNC